MPPATEGTPALAADEVHLWLARVDDAPPTDTLATWLDDAERARLVRLQRAEDRALFALAHAALRDVLARSLGIAARSVQIGHDTRGKPHLAPSHACDLRFNLAHAGLAVLIGIARGRELGVDIEAVIAHDDLRAVAEQVYSADERAALDACPTAARTNLFYTLWTRKEACLKAWGCGLDGPLQQFSVHMAAHDDIAAPVGTSLPSLHCRDLPAPPGHVAAIAVSGGPTTAVCRRWHA
ncbi:MAG: 4'-phosphopantetheinyl transferase superfamily protein [Methyloversatilis discipulorum]|nr:4'-phosphopantetheinyl transferase superfamily protein [Methyloversatilis discipulorum]